MVGHIISHYKKIIEQIVEGGMEWYINPATPNSTAPSFDYFSLIAQPGFSHRSTKLTLKPLYH